MPGPPSEVGQPVPAVRRADDGRPGGEGRLDRRARQQPVAGRRRDLRLQRREGEERHAGVLEDRVAEDVLHVVVDHRGEPSEHEADEAQPDDQDLLGVARGTRPEGHLAPVDGDQDERRAAPGERRGDRQRRDALHEPRGPDVEWDQPAPDRDRRDHREQREAGGQAHDGIVRRDGAGAERARRRGTEGDRRERQQPRPKDRERSAARRRQAGRRLRAVEPARQPGDEDPGDATGGERGDGARGIARRERHDGHREPDQSRAHDRRATADADLEQAERGQAGRPGHRHLPDQGRRHEAHATELH